MAIKTQGTQLYVIDPGEGSASASILKVGCVTSIDGVDTSIDQRETTCLEDLARTYEAGMATPGNATFGINFDPQDNSHVRMHELKVAGTTLQWAIGFSDGRDIPPTLDEDSDGNAEFVLPASRTWLTFDGYMSSYPFSFAIAASVTSTVGIQVSGEPAVLPKGA